jgi:acetyltransferase EpsM
MKNVLIFPYSGTAVEAIDCLGDQWNCIGFISDDTKMIGQKKLGIEIFDRQAFHKFQDASVIAIHGSPASFLKRKEILDSLQIKRERFGTIIHPRASVSKNASIGKNVLIMAGVVVTANAIIGDHVVILPNSVVHHDSIIGDLTLIAANVTIAGNVNIGVNCYIGAASSIKNGVTIGDRTLVGIGANVTDSFGGQQKLVGNPAKPL